MNESIKSFIGGLYPAEADHRPSQSISSKSFFSDVCNDNTPGVWFTYWEGSRRARMHDSEISALRSALKNGMKVRFVPFQGENGVEVEEYLASGGDQKCPTK